MDNNEKTEKTKYYVSATFHNNTGSLNENFHIEVHCEKDELDEVYQNILQAKAKLNVPLM